MESSFSEWFDLTRAFLAAYFTFVALFYTARIILLKHAITKEVVFAGPRFSNTWWNHMTFRVFRVVIWMVCVFRLFFPALDQYLGLFAGLQHGVLMLIGNTLLVLGLGSIMVMHYRLSRDWRSGIDPTGPGRLICEGVYRYSRNPMFICVGLTQLGFFLALPSVFSLFCLFLGLYILQRQVLAEEKHLSELFSDQYAVYCSRVRRWF